MREPDPVRQFLAHGPFDLWINCRYTSRLRCLGFRKIHFDFLECFAFGFFQIFQAKQKAQQAHGAVNDK